MSGQIAFVRLGRETTAAFGHARSRFWFQNWSTSPLELARMGIGAALLVNYGLATPYLSEFWGETGWMPEALASRYAYDPWMQSVFFYFSRSSSIFQRRGSCTFFMCFFCCAALPLWLDGERLG
jgi:hypothetical protein